MSKNLGKLLIGASMAIGMGALAANPVQAGTLSNPIIGGTAASDYSVYGVLGNNTIQKINPTAADLKDALTGNAASPTGNVELRASTEKSTFTVTDFTKNTSLSGKIGDKYITLSSLTASDWATTNYKSSGKNFGRYWFDSALTANNVSLNANSSLDAAAKTNLFNIFQTYGGFERFSDPNISYVNQNDTTGLISIGLAGHLNATSLISKSIDAYIADSKVSAANKAIATGLKSKLPASVQASEIVKYTYNGVTDYLYSFQATNSGLTDKADSISHNGNYEVTIVGVPKKAPEPSAMLGILGVAGVFAAQRKLKKASA